MIGGSDGKVMVETIVWEDGGGDATEESGRSGLCPGNVRTTR
jgi:hypothetical protein